MARVTGDHRSAAWLRHVSDKKSRPVIKAARVIGKALKKVQQPRMTPIAVARKSHHLPVGAADWRDTPPARHPRAYEPIGRAARGAGPGTEPNSRSSRYRLHVFRRDRRMRCRSVIRLID